MKWLKRGLIWEPDKNKWYFQHYGIIPTPDYLEAENVIRIYFASTDKYKYGRIFSIDVDADNPSHIVRTSDDILLDLGEIGCFDDSGVNPSCVIQVKGQKLLYYIGYQRSHKVPYLLLSGVAEIKADQMIRIKETPILERTPTEKTIRSATTIIFDQGIYKMWYVSAFKWETINTDLFKNKQMPNYVIKYAESIDGFEWNVKEGIAIDYINSDEFGFGRPWVIKDGNLYKMWYSIRKRNKSYRIGYAESDDGISWIRKDNEAGIDISKDGWDSEMICYPAVVKVKDKTYMFFNGNNNGESGFGYAELIEE